MALASDLSHIANALQFFFDSISVSGMHTSGRLIRSATSLSTDNELSDSDGVYSNAHIFFR
ncbi:MAG: hypothetical protein J1F66_04360 [Clostridiales bacterium]|nr:hypothetical protein [Clostridiales bacterium]